MASSAHEFVHKTSDVPGDRPTSEDFGPGEIALNTDSQEPGVFFLTNDGRSVKAGPSIVSSRIPANTPENGESWLDLINGTLNLGTEEDAKRAWRKVASPFLGGSKRTVFVAPEFEYSSDQIGNNGQSLPFRSLNRAILELTKNLLHDTVSGGGPIFGNQRYTIIFAPSRLIANNSPGKSLSDFSVAFPEDPTHSPEVGDLIAFNSEIGGMIFPPYFSIIGMDLQRCEIYPSYVPSYQHPGLPPEHAGSNEPITAILKPSLTSYFETVSFGDKIRDFEVFKITAGEGGRAILHSRRPHGVSREEEFSFAYDSNFDRQSRKFIEGTYIVDPIDTFAFSLISKDPSTLTDERVYVLYSELVPTGTLPQFKLFASSKAKSAHRLRCLKEASVKELADFFVKVQRAYSSFFGGQVVPGYDIVDKLYSTEGKESSVDFFRNIFIRSDYGLSGGELDGDKLPGVVTLRVENSEIISRQNDPAAFEIYTTLPDNNGNPVQSWWPLIKVAYNSMEPASRPQFLYQTPEEVQLSVLNSTPTENIRYFYDSKKNESGKSFGFSDQESDFRHFGLKVINSGFIYTDNVPTQAAIGKWSLNGGTIIDSDSESKFGALALRAEGFKGIGTVSGANDNLKGFKFEGIYSSLSLTRKQVEDTQNKRILTLGGRIVDIELSSTDPDVQLVRLSCEFLPSYILPYSLRPGTAVWVNSGSCTYRGFLATDGRPTAYTEESGQFAGKTVLRIRLSDSTIPTDTQSISALDIPYIRRFVDPRSREDSSYRIILSNTNQNSIPPSPGNILRLDQSSPGTTNPQIRQNVQFDPGEQGGWGRVFVVSDVETVSSALSPNFNYSVSDEEQDSKYLVNLSVSDFSKPWDQDQNLSTGNNTTKDFRNWYSAENDFWENLYYETPLSEYIGPKKLPPSDPLSPFVQAAHFEKQDSCQIVYQGNYAPDPNLEDYTSQNSYLRGYTVPNTQYQLKNCFDYDDGSESLGIVLKRKLSSYHTNLVSTIDSDAVIQKESSEGELVRYRPEIVEFSVLSPKEITNPRQNISIIKFYRDGIEEYMQVVSLVGSRIQAIRLNERNSLYSGPQRVDGNLPVWESGEIVNICEFDDYPNHRAYDPDWSNSKRSIVRFFEVMGYSKALTNSFLYPRFWGERQITIPLLPYSPDTEGYAKATAQWAIEFNEPSTIVANSHSWDSCGYLDPSRGIRSLRTSSLSRKLAYDSMAYASWGGRLIVNGVDEKGEQISIGLQREALTARHQEPIVAPTVSIFSQQLYEDQPYVEFPGQVVVYRTDDFSEEFNANKVEFKLTRGGFPVPLNHLEATSMFVQVGSVTQRPNIDYWLIGDLIRFRNAPPAGVYCDVRVVTSEDDNKTMVVATLEMQEEIDNSRSIFSLNSEQDIRLLDIDYDNLLVFLGGVLQTPESSYFLTRDTETSLTISFSEPLIEGTTPDIRAVCTNNLWASRGVFPVALYSLDSLAPLFDGNEKSFPLTYGGKRINSALVNSENCLVSIGGSVQIPDYSYQIRGGEITFSEAPDIGATSEIRVITNAPFIPCLDKRGKKESFLYWGPSVVLELENELNRLRNEG
jgi:hypothetical protein